MSSDQSTGLGTEAGDYGDLYYNDAHLGGHGDYSWDSAEWRDFFRNVVTRLTAILSPTTALDVGCAKGLLVQALVEAGVDARGSDVSEFAISHAHEDVRARLSVSSATEPIQGDYDLITCIEVLEHMSAEDAQKAIDNMCAATNRILFSSTPSDFRESTHVNVRPTPQWASWFAERGFFRRTDIDASFVSPWAIVLERSDLSRPSLVDRYETLLSPLSLELADKRQALLDADRQMNELRGRIRDLEERAPKVVQPDDARIVAVHPELTTRDHIMGLEATVIRLNRDLQAARARIKRLRSRVGKLDEELDAMRTSTTWRLGRAVTRPLGKMRR